MRLILTLAFIALPSLAMALSCLPPNAAREVNFALERNQEVTIVKGTLVPPSGSLKRRAFEDVSAVYNLLGARLMAYGDDQTFIGKVTVTSGCMLDQWCGQIVKKPTKAVFILRNAADGQYRMNLSPCPSAIYPDYGANEERILRNCLARGRCTERDIEQLDRR